MNIIITGATGVAGLAVYRAALADPAIKRVTLLSRRAMPDWAELPPNAADKTELVLHTDFASYSPDLARRLAGHDALVWALGKSAVGLSEAHYTEITHTYALAAANAIRAARAETPRQRPFRFVFISGELADQTGQSSQMWARVKGRTERDLLALDPAHFDARVYRPGHFSPPREYPRARAGQLGFAHRVADTLSAPLFALFPQYSSPIGDMARFIVELAKGRWPEQALFMNADMRRLVKEVTASPEETTGA